MKRLDCSVVVKVKVKGKIHPVNVHLNNISATAKLSVTKLGTVMHHHEPNCLSKNLVCCIQGKGHSEGSCHQR